MTLPLDISTLTADYANGSRDPGRVLSEIHARIREADNNAWITIVPEAAAKENLGRATRGPLWGVPFAVKDNIDVAGLPTTCACPEFSYTPTQSAVVVERLEAAGAILIGKTNMDQFATGLVGTRSPYGVVRNPFDKRYISGGSSSGSAVAVAEGLVSFALGTDTAGSGRVPAAFNNIVGLKPTKGLISTRGVYPACRTQDVVSIFAGTVGDAQYVFDVVASFDHADPYSRRPPTAVPPAPRQAFRFGVPAAPIEFFGDGDYARLFDDASDRLSALGGTRVDIDIAPFLEAARLLYEGPWVAERLAAVRDFARDHPDAMDTVVRGVICGADSINAASAFRGFYRLAELVRASEVKWAKMDMLLLPTAGTIYKLEDVAADPVRLNANLGTYTNFANLMDLSAVAVPAGIRGDGLPFGVTLLAPAFGDAWLIEVADRLHRALPNSTVGGTGHPLPAAPVRRGATPVACRVAVVGAHLSGQPLNGQLVERKARLVETTRTGPGYSFYALPGTTPPKPGLVFDGRGAGGIEVEIWEMDAAGFGSFVALIPPPLGIGMLTLEDGRRVQGFLCEGYAVQGALDITTTGGWRSWLASRQ